MGTIRSTVRKAQQVAKESAALIARALKWRRAGGDVCLSVEECEELIKKLGESSTELDELLAKREGKQV